ncbi:MAG: hypothetical protein M3Y45_07400 [Actinomycetota bacterium]|nr:hypothetical protein [Actinomycetota bacterium]
MAQPLLIFLNEVAGGRLLLDAVREKAADASYVVVVAPQNQPQAGQLFDRAEAREAARARVDVTLAVLDEFGIDAVGEVLDPASDMALGDAIRAHRPSEVLLSCLYDYRFGWTRRDLLEWAVLTFEPGTKITHIPVRIEQDSIRFDVTHTLVVANKTLASRDLHERLLHLGEERPHRFTVVAPTMDGVSENTVARNLAALMAELYRAGIDATGQPMSPDAFAAVQNAIEHYRVDDILISTLGAEESQWLEDDLVGRVREITEKQVTHHETGRLPQAVAAAVAQGDGSEESANAESNEA